MSILLALIFLTDIVKSLVQCNSFYLVIHFPFVIIYYLSFIILQNFDNIYKCSMHNVNWILCFQNAPKVELNHLDLGNKLVTPDRTLEYVFLEGEVKALGKPLQSQFGDKKGVIQQLTYIEHKTKKNAGVW